MSSLKRLPREKSLEGWAGAPALHLTCLPRHLSAPVTVPRTPSSCSRIPASVTTTPVLEGLLHSLDLKTERSSLRIPFRLMMNDRKLTFLSKSLSS